MLVVIAARAATMRCRSEDSATGSDFHSGHAAGEQHQEAIPMPAPEDAAFARQRRYDVVDHLGVASWVRLLVGDIHAVPADEADAKHDSGHGHPLIRNDGATG